MEVIPLLGHASSRKIGSCVQLSFFYQRIRGSRIGIIDTPEKMIGSAKSFDSLGAESVCPDIGIARPSYRSFRYCIYRAGAESRATGQIFLDVNMRKNYLQEAGS
jgi:hypothetical protein